ncbi:YpiF family protein [Bhargavaea cecembensis]|uniref:YpiF family protein n=1 Tax=Bhargavaea cecembensis TaxID=394098 RepID=UPI00058C97A7|nr:YpiF family protein [Bhargavaea cecembensis]
MNWTAKDMDLYLQQTDYIDTALVPLVAIGSTEQDMKQSASSAEFLMNLTVFLEHQFKGRIMLLPPFSYVEKGDKSRLAAEWRESLGDMPFKHVFFLTTDPAWTRDAIIEEAIWIPSIPIEHMDKKLKQSVLEDQVRQIIPLLTAKWTGQ